MADTNQNRRADLSEFSDSDPFAELTRIMGHDPRADKPEEDVAGSGDDYEIDLEKELMGDLDFTEFDEPAAQSGEANADLHVPEDERADAIADFDDDTPAMAEDDYAVAAAGSGGAEAARYDVGSDEDAFEFDDAVFADEAHAAGDEPAALQDAPFDSGAELAPEDDFGDALERELMAPPTHQAAAETAYAPMTADPVGWASADETDAQGVADEDEFADVDMDFGPLEADAEDDAGLSVSESSGDDLSPHLELSESVEDQPVAADGSFDAGMSLEDELSALLADPMAQADVTPPAPAHDTWQPSVSTFGRSNFPAQTPAEPQHAAVDKFTDPVVAESVTAEPADASLADDDFSDIFGSDLDLDLPSETEPAQSADPAPAYGASQQRAQPEPDALADWRPEPARFEQAEISGSDGDDAPDVETVDVSETAYAMTDDLDIPGVDYGAPAPAKGIYDDLESEFTEAFGDLSVEEQPVAAPAPVSAGPSSWATPAAAAAASYAAGRGGVRGDAAPAQTADAYALGEGQWQAGEEFADYDTDLDEAIAMSAFDEQEPAAPASRNRGMLVAAIVAAVAIVGGIGVFGMAMVGGGSDAPAVVRADDNPMKVRPENPGGTTVPNQDSEAYQRVAGGAQDVAPEQESLITTAEEPVDVDAQPDVPALAPGISDGDEPASAAAEPSLAPASPDAPQPDAPEAGASTEIAAIAPEPKSEDRIEQVIDEAGVGANNDLVAVAPRRVRTMVVRPDGTMVPREDPTPAAVAEPESIATAPLAGAPTLVPAGSPLPQPGDTIGAAQDAAGEEDAGPVVDTPDTVGVVPSQRVETQIAAAPVAQPAAPQPAATQTPPATPVSAPAAAASAAGAASEWSMQIASQPTAESAQSTYQDLARRYGGVLEGRGVNIVRADIEGKGVYYRVRIPATNRDEAIQLCTQYKSAGGSCFVSR